MQGLPGKGIRGPALLAIQTEPRRAVDAVAGIGHLDVACRSRAGDAIAPGTEHRDGEVDRRIAGLELHRPRNGAAR